MGQSERAREIEREEKRHQREDRHIGKKSGGRGGGGTTRYATSHRQNARLEQRERVTPHLEFRMSFDTMSEDLKRRGRRRRSSSSSSRRRRRRTKATSASGVRGRGVKG